VSPEAVDTSERALIAHVRHEIRTPISAIVAYSELLIEDAGDGGAEAGGPDRCAVGQRWPRAAAPGMGQEHDPVLPMAGFALIIWAEAAVDMRHSPVATGLLLLTITVGAVVFGVLFPRRTWCRHVCPLGGFSGVCATSAFLEIRPTPDICAAKCKGHACYTGGGQQGRPGCPMFQHVMFVETNQHCVLCLDCVRNCPNGSPRLNLRWPGRELWAGQTARPGSAAFVLLLFGLLAAQIVIDRIGPAPGWHRFWLSSVAMAAGAAVPVGAVWWLRRSLRDKPPEAAKAVWDRIMAVAPVMAAGFLAYQVSFTPALGDVVMSLGYHPVAASGREWASVDVLSAVQAFILAAGLSVTAFVLWKLGRAGPRKERADG
jgi:ferredoxin